MTAKPEKVYADFLAYARSIGCLIVGDEINSNGQQRELLAAWLCGLASGMREG